MQPVGCRDRWLRAQTASQLNARPMAVDGGAMQVSALGQSASSRFADD